jgi:hypothetical protein
MMVIGLFDHGHARPGLTAAIEFGHRHDMTFSDFRD